MYHTIKKYFSVIMAICISSTLTHGTNNTLSKHALIADLYAIGTIQYGSFTLKNGAKSSWYFDLRRVISYPSLFSVATYYMWQAVEDCPYDYICAVPYAAIPMASVMAALHEKPLLMARKEAKDHGTKKMIEGVYKKGGRVLLVEDVITSGGSILETVAILEKEGLHVHDVVVFLDRQEGGKERLAHHGITVHAVYTMAELVDILRAGHQSGGAHIKK